MENVSIFAIILFLLASAGTVWFFYRAGNNSLKVLAILLAWASVQSALAMSGFYQNWDATPPRFIFLFAPWLLVTIIMFNVNSTKQFIDLLDIKWLTILHIIRIPVEVTLFLVFSEKLIPQSMTFEGTNFDILSGISAPVIYYIAFKTKKRNQKLLLIWNFVCLGLLLNVVITAILSAKTPFQQFAFDQPNIAISYFPFALLPSLVVPLVLFSHLASIRQLVYTAKR